MGGALLSLRQESPCRLLIPGADPLPTAVLLTTTGGLASGDQIRCHWIADPGCAARITTQAAEKIYRARPGDPPVLVDVEIDVGAGAWVEWVPQETLLFDDSALTRITTARIAPEGRLLAAEMSVFGRIAGGERWQTGRLDDRWSVSVGGDLRWLDQALIDDGALLDHPQALHGARAIATVIYVGPPGARDDLRALLNDTLGEDVAGGLTEIDGVIVGRLMGADPAAVRRCLGAFLAQARALLADLPPTLPRVWLT